MLFLGAGSVITAMHHEQDMRNYGGLRKKIPFTFWAMMIGTFAITGVGIPLTHIGFAGSSPRTRSSRAPGPGTNATAGYAFWMLVVAACFTSFYSWRLIFSPSSASRAATTTPTTTPTRARARCWSRSACSPSARCSPA